MSNQIIKLLLQSCKAVAFSVKYNSAKLITREEYCTRKQDPATIDAFEKVKIQNINDLVKLSWTENPAKVHQEVLSRFSKDPANQYRQNWDPALADSFHSSRHLNKKDHVYYVQIHYLFPDAIKLISHPSYSLRQMRNVPGFWGVLDPQKHAELLEKWKTLTTESERLAFMKDYRNVAREHYETLLKAGVSCPEGSLLLLDQNGVYCIFDRLTQTFDANGMPITERTMHLATDRTHTADGSAFHTSRVIGKDIVQCEVFGIGTASNFLTNWTNNIISPVIWTTVKDFSFIRDLYEKWHLQDASSLEINNDGFEDHLLNEHRKVADHMARLRFLSKQGQRFGIWWRLFVGTGAPFAPDSEQFVAEISAKLDENGKYTWDDTTLLSYDFRGDIELFKVEKPKEGLHIGDESVRIGFDVGIPAIQTLADTPLSAYEKQMRTKLDEVIGDVWNVSMEKNVRKDLTEDAAPKVNVDAINGPTDVKTTIEAFKIDPRTVGDAYERIVTAFREVRSQAVDEMHADFSQDPSYKVFREELTRNFEALFASDFVVRVMSMPNAIPAILSDVIYEVVDQGTKENNEKLEKEIKKTEGERVDLEVRAREARDLDDRLKTEETKSKRTEIDNKILETEKKLKDDREKLKERYDFRSKVEYERNKDAKERRTSLEDFRRIVKL
ncbi:MAG: hypothetical protein Q9170_001382 [Blastenia crenularia]